MPHWKNKKPESEKYSRTLSMKKANPFLFFQKNAFTCATRFGDIPCVDRFTRNFNQPLISMGSNVNREKIALFPDSPLLHKTYQSLMKKIQENGDYSEHTIIQAIKTTTSLAFPGKKPHAFINKRIRIDKCQEQIISLNAFIQLGHGVCRHHALLNAYLLSRLQEDGFISGSIIHHRQNFQGKQSAHTWILFLSDSGRLYSIDSLWKKVIVANSTIDLNKLNRLYDAPNIAPLIEKRLKQCELFFPENRVKPSLSDKRQTGGLYIK